MRGRVWECSGGSGGVRVVEELLGRVTGCRCGLILGIFVVGFVRGCWWVRFFWCV